MATSIVSPAPGRVGNGYLVRVGLSSTGVAGDTVTLSVPGIGIVSDTARVTVGATHCDCMWGWNYFVDVVQMMGVEFADGAAMSLKADWFDSVGSLKDTSTTAGYLWDASSNMPNLIQFALGRYSNATLAAILAAVRKTFQNAP